MAPARDKWIRRFIIPETTRHKKGFTIYKVTSMIFLNSSHEEISKVSVWKRYNDFKKLHLELNNLHKQLGIKESFPILPKSKYFGRFETEVVEERRQYALKFLEFIGRYSYLYSSDIFITFFETSHVDNTNDCAYSLSSDTSEDDRIVSLNNFVFGRDTTMQSTFQIPCVSKTSPNVLIDSCATSSTVYIKENESHDITNLSNATIVKDQYHKTTKQYTQDITKDYDAHLRNKNLDISDIILCDKSRFDSLNNNSSKDLLNFDTAHSACSIIHEKANFSQISDSTQYILIAAGHISSAFKHESIAEYEEAFTQYKLGISCLITGVQFDPDSIRTTSIKDKISKYLTRAEQLYNTHLNCNISLLNKPTSELQYYKILKTMKSIMLVMDTRVNCSRIIKTIEKSSIHKDNINNYILHRQVPCMVCLYAYVETETTIFFILQYASYGKLWDFIKLHYKTSEELPIDTISNRTCLNINHIPEEFNSNKDIYESNEADKATKSDKTQGQDHPCSINSQNEIYNMEMPTTQLLEKSQKLLQSVNATLRRSNFIASRLNKSKELKHSENMLSSNAKTIPQISKDSGFISDIYRNKTSNPDSINLDGINEVTSIQNISTSNMMYICKNYGTYIGSTSSETNSSNINCGIDVTNNPTLDKLYNVHEIQYSHLYKQNNVVEKELWQIPETIIRSWGAEILSALEALHQQDILIFDFKPDNILLDDTGHIRLTYIVPQHNRRLSKLIYPYSSPESIIFSPTILVTSATDIWSFGIILYELLTGIAFVAKHPRLFHSHSIINIPTKLSENAKSLLHGMLKYYPDERLTIDEIKHHPFFAGIDWSNIVNFQM